jgi:hypothetical protein
MMMDNPPNMSKYAIFATALFIFILILPSAEATTFTCTFEKWDGTTSKCSEATVGDNWPYKITQTTYQGQNIYKVHKDDTYLYFLDNPAYITYNWQRDKISWTINAASKADLVSKSYPHNATVRFLNITTIIHQ